MVLDGTGSVYDDTGWYLVIISWYCLIYGSAGSERACMPVYIGTSGDLSGATDASHTDRHQNIELLSLYKV